MSTRRIERILVATDGTSDAREAVDVGLELAAAEGAEVAFLHVVPPVEYIAGRGFHVPKITKLAEDGDQVLAQAASLADERGVEHTSDVYAGPAGKVIVSMADAVEADLIVVGARRPRLRFGSVSNQVARDAKRPVPVACGHEHRTA